MVRYIKCILASMFLFSCACSGDANAPNASCVGEKPVSSCNTCSCHEGMWLCTEIACLDMTADMVSDMSQDMFVEDMIEKDMSAKDMVSKDMRVSDLSSEDMMPDSSSDMPDLPADMPIVHETGGETCAVALDVTAGGTWENQSTRSARDSYNSGIGDPGCPNARVSGADLSYFVRPKVDTKYKIVVTPVGDFDPMLYVRQDCAMKTCVDGTVLNGKGVLESLTLDTLADQTYYIIVDGELLSNGDYTLSIEVVN